MTDGLQITLAIAGGVSALGGAAAYIHKAVKPFSELSKRVERVEQHEKQDLQRFEAMERKLEEMFQRSDAADQALYRAMLSLIDHTIDGNSVENMKKARKELREHIIKK